MEQSHKSARMGEHGIIYLDGVAEWYAEFDISLIDLATGEHPRDAQGRVQAVIEINAEHGWALVCENDAPYGQQRIAGAYQITSCRLETEDVD